MITATELRIGNYVSGMTGLCEVRGITKKGIWLSDKGGPVDEKLIDPYQVTTEWLERLGFEDTTSYGDYHIKISDYAYLWVGERNGQIREVPQVADHDTDAPCKYVHQLQNLYFALTGKELEVTQ